MKPKVNRRRFVKIAAIQSLALVSGSSILRASKTPNLQSWSGILFGSEASIQIAHTDSRKANTLLQRCVTELQRLESIFTLYDHSSELSRLNQLGYLQSPSPEFLELLTTAVAYGEKTDGAFDVSIHPVVEALRTGASPSELEKARQLVGFRNIQASANSIRLLTSGAQLTLNGIAQGFITDKIAELLMNEGMADTLVQLGEKRALGQHPAGRPWNIGLADPFSPSEIADVIELSDRALASSGGYGTQFETSPGAHHLVNPKTGRSSHSFAAVHVLAPTATEADALSTALSACSPKHFEKIKGAFPDIRVITVPRA
ncbi:FAD:protein FMN transferase [Pelagicoccus mobilis]|uniref:FAD:protein FMN transferase n=1 Tax=Pelagicoccus mobilis TaxID=415221 RepID=A0A934RTR9_9BACT|nr:FAD:protein FMN transferase [Pelagicoccus mobilis]MBK1876283.1 FAD:protein FMN transferase [Pelagicoccus mobilis]